LSAAYYGRAGVVKLLLAGGGVLVNAEDKHGCAAALACTGRDNVALHEWRTA
jgi:hypothetical protein